MPRLLRIHVPGGFYHVTLRGNHSQDIFFRPADRLTLESIVSEVISKHGARVHAYCWMTNHIHLVIQVSNTPLGQIMLRIASRYARKVQARFQTTGHLFERRYHAVLVDEDEYLLTVLRYIHCNPVLARMARSVDRYRWSSHAAYAGTRSQPWVTTDFALAMFHANRPAAIEAYLRFMQVDQVDEANLASHPDDSRVLGGDRFLAEALDDRRPRPRTTIDEVIAEACDRFGVRIEELSSISRNRRMAMARAWLAHRAVACGVGTICEIARRLQRHEASVRGLMRRHPAPD